jgi:glycosyltransferase involved in cell wall biosynthesis
MVARLWMVARLNDTGTRVATFATQGERSRDAVRAEMLVASLSAEVWPFDRRRRARSALEVVRRAIGRHPDLIVMEGTGMAGGLPLILSRLLKRTRYVVSTGDAVGPYAASVIRVARPFAAVYERLLYSLAAGVIGWSPYMTGRALTLGARRAMTAPHWSQASGTGNGHVIRNRLGIPEDSIVVGVAGSLVWNRRRGYCYGLEIVAALEQVARPDVVGLIVGGGNGSEKLLERAGTALGHRVFLPGEVPGEQLDDYLAAMDIAVLAQSVDGVGSHRYTAKLSDYIRAGLPVISTQVPVAYDLGVDWMWRLEGDAPWDPRHINALAALLQGVSREEVERHRDRVPREAFNAESQQRAVTAFLVDLIET